MNLIMIKKTSIDRDNSETYCLWNMFPNSEEAYEELWLKTIISWKCDVGEIQQN